MTEISEYVKEPPSSTQRLVAEGETVGSLVYETKLKAYKR